jgi:hypothetical protein
MKILLATITRNRKGQALRAERTLESDMPAVGRGAQCAIHLPDPRVSLEHATIYMAEGARRIAGVGGAVLVVEGRLEGEVVLAPRSRFEIGPYLFTVEVPPAGYDLALMYELVRPLPDGPTEIKSNSRFSLAAEGVSKRALAWGFFGVVGVLFLLLPVINAVTPPLRAATAKLKLTPDLAWNPGPLSTGHAGLTHDCGACHQVPFLRVRDKACNKCHENVPNHVHDRELQAKLFGSTRCAECHADHLGAEAPLRTDAGLCSSCHADLRKFDANTPLRDASDFARAHPEFKLTLWRGPGPKDVVRVLQSDKASLVERSNLKFPHDAHLKPNLKAPKGKVTLACGNCHVPDAGGKGFLPIEMKKHCAECHSLEFEPAVTTRQVPHGSVREALLTMEEFYANIVLSNVAVDEAESSPIRRQIPKPSAGVVTEEQRKRALAFARTKAEQVGADLFEKRVCVVCHDVRRAAEPQGASGMLWTVAPVHVAGSWMPYARFDHAKHRTSECKDCHDGIARSKRSGDVNIPDLASCRVCHAGSEPAANKVVSTCVSCHAYHPGERVARKSAAAPAAATGAKQ